MVGAVSDKPENNLNFLHFRCSQMSHKALDYWISVPEFAERIRFMISKGVYIDKQSVFEVMRSIYLDHEKAQDQSFRFGIALLGVESLWRSISGTKKGWRGE